MKPMSAAEKMRRYRKRLKANNPDKYEEQRKRNLERMRSKYKYKKICDMTDSEKVTARQKWKEQKRMQNMKKIKSSSMSRSTDFMVKLETEESGQEVCETAVMHEVLQIKDEPEEDLQPQESFTGNDPLTSDPLRTLTSSNLEPAASEPVKCEEVQLEAVDDSEGSEYREQSVTSDVLDDSGSEALEIVSLVAEPSGSDIQGNEYCRICGTSITIDSVAVGRKGLASLIWASEMRQDHKYPPGTNPPIRVHYECRKKYTNPKNIASHMKKLLRCELDPNAPVIAEIKGFDYLEQCLICGGDASTAFIQKETKQPEQNRKVVHRITRPETGEALYRALERPGSETEELRKRIKGKNLVGQQARYHRHCFQKLTLNEINYRIGRPSDGRAKKGRPPSETVQARFNLICDYIENNWEDSQFQHDDIQRDTGISMTDMQTSFRHKFPERYGVAFTKRSSTSVLTPGFTIPDDWYEKKLTDEKDERLRIVRTAANIILEDIRSIAFDNRSYPPPSSFLDEASVVIPETLKTFVDTVVTKYKKKPENLSSTVTALSHSIMTAARPKTFKSPLLLSIGCFINQKHSSKSLIQLLSSVGFCAPYKDVTQFEVSVAYGRPSETKPKFTQFAFDAVDTEINGHKSQCLVGVQCVTPRLQDSSIIRREQITQKLADWWCSKTPLETYVKGTSGLKDVIIEDHRDDTSILPTKGDALWLFGKSDPSLNLPRWDAFMKKKSKDKEYPLSEIHALPVIHAPASYDAVYTALKEVQCGERGTRVVTFSQPLYQIAQDIVNSEVAFNNIVLRLGGFYLMMSYLGAIGYIMLGSGLEQLWCGIYAAEQTSKMMTGHSFARAVRAHFLTRSALFSIITKDFDLTPEEKLEIEVILDEKTQGITLDDENSGVKKYQEPLSITLELLEKRGPTAQLWVQYFRMTTLMAQFIEAERTANWDLHLSTVKKMLPYFHASGHFDYAKSCSLYLQDMQKLESKMSEEEFVDFTKNGYFAVRRADKQWADMWTDLIVEQTMGRLMERPGGVANGRRVTDDVLGHWTDAAPTLSAVADLLEDFCRTADTSAEESSRNKDKQDVAKLQSWFEEHTPFDETENLISIGTGVVGGSKTRCHQAEDIGKQMMAQKVGQNYHDVSFHRARCVLPLSSINSAIQIENFKVPIEADTILKRIHITKENQEEMKSYFDYELAPYALSLFNDKGMIESRKKSECFTWFVPVEVAEGGNRSHVIDGEFLLHRVTWKEGADIMTIINSYIEYVKANFTNAVVVFGTRKGTYIKSRKVNSKTPAIEFQKNTVITANQESFLSNERNRDKFIQYLLIDLTRSGITVKLSPNDLDAYIVQTATSNASTYEETCVVSDNPDLLVIMTGLITKKNIYFMKPGRGKKPTVYYHVDSFGINKIKLSIMFIHAVCGSDSTSAIFEKTRAHAGMNMSSIPSKVVKQLMTIFKDPNASANAIAGAGYMFMRHLYHYHGDDVPIDDLNVVRYEQFTKSVTKSKGHLAFLPPSKEAVRQHMYRTYHQIQKWLGNDLPATAWGWKLVGDRLEPITTLAEPAPKELLDLISCKCVSMCTSECNCKRAGLECCVLCVNCNGRVCHGVDMDSDAYEEGYRTLSGCDALGNPVGVFESIDDAEDANDENDESESGPTHPKRPRRETKEDRPNTVEEVYIVECQDLEPSEGTSNAIGDNTCRATRRPATLSLSSD